MSDGNRDGRDGRTGEAEILEPAPTPEEAAAAELLRSALEEGAPARNEATREALAVVGALRAAWSPSDLDEAVHAGLVDDLPVSAEEQAEAAALARRLDAGDMPEIATVLRSSWNPPAISEAENRLRVNAAIAERPKRRPSRARHALVFAATSIALAASVVVWITSGSLPEAAPVAPLAKARSTQPLFDEPFGAGDGSARIDRIAVARASDYRDNRFAKWGLR
jgi:hypothetical protein